MSVQLVQIRCSLGMHNLSMILKMANADLAQERPLDPMLPASETGWTTLPHVSLTALKQPQPADFFDESRWPNCLASAPQVVNGSPNQRSNAPPAQPGKEFSSHLPSSINQQRAHQHERRTSHSASMQHKEPQSATSMLPRKQNRSPM